MTPRRLTLTLACLLATSSCDRMAKERERSQSGAYTATDSMGAALRDIRAVPLHAAPELVENSGGAMSRSQPGVVFTINDSGNDPLLFAFDTSGADRGVWRVQNATNVDWESIAIAPCVPSAPRGESCVYIGDTGDNNGRHPFRVIYRVREPNAIAGRAGVTAEQLVYTYPDGPHDVEAMYVAPTGDIVLITKRPLAAGGGRLREALVFVVPASGWSGTSSVVARLVDSLPIVPGSAPLRMITDAALSPDGSHLAVRTYAQVFIFATNVASGLVDHRVPARVCNLVPLGEPQGEGVTWVDDRGRLAFTSEGRTALLRLATCSVG